jgi:hypothetical protein
LDTASVLGIGKKNIFSGRNPATPTRRALKRRSALASLQDAEVRGSVDWWCRSCLARPPATGLEASGFRWSLANSPFEDEKYSESNEIQVGTARAWRILPDQRSSPRPAWANGPGSLASGDEG